MWFGIVLQLLVVDIQLRWQAYPEWEWPGWGCWYSRNVAWPVNAYGIWCIIGQRGVNEGTVVTELRKISSSPQEHKSKGCKRNILWCNYVLQNWGEFRELGWLLFAAKARCRQGSALRCVTSSKSTNVLSLDSTEDIPIPSGSSRWKRLEPENYSRTTTLDSSEFLDPPPKKLKLICT